MLVERTNKSIGESVWHVDIWGERPGTNSSQSRITILWNSLSSLLKAPNCEVSDKSLEVLFQAGFWTTATKRFQGQRGVILDKFWSVIWLPWVPVCHCSQERTCMLVCVRVWVYCGGAAGRQETKASYRALKKKHWVYTTIRFLYKEFSASIKPLHIPVNQTQSWPERRQETLHQMVWIFWWPWRFWVSYPWLTNYNSILPKYWGGLSLSTFMPTSYLLLLLKR